MIQIVPQMKILVALEAVDGRKGIDSLARLCQEKLQEDPFSGCLFVFRSRRGTSIRILSTAFHKYTNVFMIAEMTSSWHGDSKEDSPCRGQALIESG